MFGSGILKQPNSGLIYTMLIGLGWKKKKRKKKNSLRISGVIPAVGPAYKCANRFRCPCYAGRFEPLDRWWGKGVSATRGWGDVDGGEVVEEDRFSPTDSFNSFQRYRVINEGFLWWAGAEVWVSHGPESIDISIIYWVIGAAEGPLIRKQWMLLLVIWS